MAVGEPNPQSQVQNARQLLDAGEPATLTIIRVITRHLRPDAPSSWSGLSFDFTGAVFDGGDFSNAVINGTRIDFSKASFVGGTVTFNSAEFTGGTTTFRDISGQDPAVLDFGSGYDDWIVSPNVSWSTSPVPSWVRPHVLQS